jgi:hypothetical protein
MNAQPRDPFSEFVGTPNELIHQLADQMREKRRETGEKWKAFDDERDRAVKANRLEDEVFQARLEELKDSYEAASAELKKIEAAWQEEAVKQYGGPFGSGSQRQGQTASSDGWAKAVFSKLNEAKALDATSGGPSRLRSTIRPSAGSPRGTCSSDRSSR